MGTGNFSDDFKRDAVAEVPKRLGGLLLVPPGVVSSHEFERLEVGEVVPLSVHRVCRPPLAGLAVGRIGLNQSHVDSPEPECQ